MAEIAFPQEPSFSLILFGNIKFDFCYEFEILIIITKCLHAPVLAIHQVNRIYHSDTSRNSRNILLVMFALGFKARVDPLHTFLPV